MGYRLALPAIFVPATLVGLWLLFSFTESRAIVETAAAQPPSETADKKPTLEEEYQAKIVPFLRQHCYDCHGDERQRGGLDLQWFATAETARKDRKVWETASDYLALKQMPPATRPQPSDAERKFVSDWIKNTLTAVDCGEPVSPGRVTLRRLNRAEYENTIRDLFGVHIELADDFPSDDVGYGFDNIGDVLSMPPILLEKYMASAEKVADRVIVIPQSNAPSKRELRADDFRIDGRRADDREIGFASNGSASASFEIEREGEYQFRSSARGTRGGDELPKLEVKLDGKLLRTFDVDAVREPREYVTDKVRLKSGRHTVEVAFPNDFYMPEARDQDQRDRNLYVRSVTVEGPYNPPPEDFPEAHRGLIQVTPGPGISADVAAREILEDFVPRAFRRPAKPGEIDRLMALVRFAQENQEPFEARIRLALRAVLCSPHFLFRVEDDPKTPETIRRVDDYEFAARLSYFLWSSMPDEELFELAGKGTLREPEVLRGQIARMLTDEKSRALGDNFFAQWLQLRNLEVVQPDSRAFSEFDDELRTAMKRETELFADRIVREDRSLIEFLDADWTFLNEKLASHYGIDGVKGEKLRVVSLPDRRRGGVLTQASVLTLTSNPRRTSPVKRGKWVLDVLLGTPPPPPPPNVEELPEGEEAEEKGTLRQRLEMHRENAICASCHQRMDPLGFGLENFNAIGQWRERDGKDKIDASGDLPDGSKFAGPAELKEVLKSKAELFRRAMAESLLTYALGRGLEYYDRCAVGEIAESVHQNGDRFSAMVYAIVTSRPFQYRASKREE